MIAVANLFLVAKTVVTIIVVIVVVIAAEVAIVCG
jgi:hypothetical protein